MAANSDDFPLPTRPTTPISSPLCTFKSMFWRCFVDDGSSKESHVNEPFSMATKNMNNLKKLTNTRCFR